jgi:hypothetical protein
MPVALTVPELILAGVLAYLAVVVLGAIAFVAIANRRDRRAAAERAARRAAGLRRP